MTHDEQTMQVNGSESHSVNLRRQRSDSLLTLPLIRSSQVQIKFYSVITVEALIEPFDSAANKIFRLLLN